MGSSGGVSHPTPRLAAAVIRRAGFGPVLPLVGRRADEPTLSAAVANRRAALRPPPPPAGRGARNVSMRGGKQWSGEKTT
jgi:hypothetical protein